MSRLEEGPSFTVPPDTWSDLRNNIVKLGNKHVGPQKMKNLGFFRVSTTGWNETFFDKHVKSSVETGSFGRIKYGVKNLSRSVVTPSNVFPGWRESRQPHGSNSTATMKGLYEKFGRQWKRAENQQLEKKLCQDDRYAAETLQSLASGKSFLYGESYSGYVNESPIAGVDQTGDLNLPINIMLLYLRLQVLFHNYAAAKGVSGLWTYVYGAWSGTVLHLEDAFLPSVNLNLGPGWKLWYFVPRSHFKQLQEYYARIGLSPKGEGCSHQFQHKRLAPSYQVLLDEGIPVFYLVQRPGDLIFVDGCVFHEVINWGYGFAQASNLLLPSWINVAEAGLYLRSHCCTEFVNDQTFSARALTERLYALLRRLRTKDRSKAEEYDAAIGHLTGIEWQPANAKFGNKCSIVGFGQALSAGDLSPELSGLFSCSPADMHPDPKSPAAFLKIYPLPQSSQETLNPKNLCILNSENSSGKANPSVTEEDFQLRRSKRLHGGSSSNSPKFSRKKTGKFL